MNLTKREIDQLQPDDEFYIKWDDSLTGYGVRVMPSGRKTFFIQFRDAHYRTRRYKIGTYGVITAEEGRETARKLLARVTLGNFDFLYQRDRKRLTLADVWGRYMIEYAPNLKASTAKENQRLWNTYISPALGHIDITRITKLDVAQLHNEFYDRPYAGNRTLSVISLLLGLAERWGLRQDGTNPCRYIKKYKEKSRERYLSDDEMAAINRELDSGKYHHSVCLAIRLLMVTGCRVGEVLTLKWDYVDTEAGLIRLPDSKTGKKNVQLNDVALALLKEATSLVGNPYVCWGDNPGDHYKDLHKPFQDVCFAAGVSNCRLHDLRHSFASAAVNSGMDMLIVRDLLGHRSVKTTEKYAHTKQSVVSQAAQSVAGRIQKAMLKTGTDNIIRLEGD